MLANAPAKLRDAMLAAVHRLDPDGVVPLCLSGGIDSATMLAASLALGRRPVCWTFHLAGLESRDLQVSRLMTAAYGLEHRVVTMPRGLPILIADLRRLYPVIRTTRKTHLQCSHPWLYLAPAIAASSPRAFLAIKADNLWGTHRSTIAYWKAYGEEWGRTERYQGFHGIGSEVSIDKTAALAGLSFLDPWQDPAVIDVMLRCDRPQLHEPRIKNLALQSFHEFWTNRPWYRKNEPYQINSGLRSYHDILLQSPANTRGSKAVVAVYRDLLADLIAADPEIDFYAEDDDDADRT